jgi:hypothetical protein
MIQIDEHGDGVADDLVGFLALDVDDKPHPARFVLILRVVQTLLGRPSGWRSRRFQFLAHQLTLFISQLILLFFTRFWPRRNPGFETFLVPGQK